MANHNYSYRWLSGNSYRQVVEQLSSTTVVTGAFGYLTIPAIKEGSPNPDYASRLDLGEPVGSPYTRVAHMSVAGISELRYSAGEHRSSPWMRNLIWGNWLSPYRYSMNSGDQYEFDAAYFKALTNLNSWLAKGVGQFEGLTFGVEFPKLVAQLGVRTRALLEAQEFYTRKMTRHLRKQWRRYGKLRRPLNNKERIRLKTSLSGYYLEYWFGVFPFLKSLESLADAFDGFTSPYLNVSGFGEVQRKIVETVIPIATFGTAKLSAVTMTRYQLRVGLKAFYKVDDLFDLNLRLGFTEADIASAGWEFLPFSWLVDYWVPISTFLETRKYCKLTPQLAFQTKVTRRTHWIAKGLVEKTSSQNYGFATWSLANKRARDVSTQMSRSILTTLPKPSAAVLLDMRSWSDGPSAQQYSYVAAATAVMSKRFRKLTKLL